MVRQSSDRSQSVVDPTTHCPLFSTHKPCSLQSWECKQSFFSSSFLHACAEASTQAIMKYANHLFIVVSPLMVPAASAMQYMGKAEQFDFANQRAQ
jgi:hypothetical protein